MEIRPILSSLRKHKIPVVLIVLEIALSCAVLCNAIFMISQRVGAVDVPNAIDQRGIVDINVQGMDPAQVNAEVPRNLAALRNIPGVTAVATVNALPLSDNGWNAPASANSGSVFAKQNVNVMMYYITHGGDKALGLKLLKGRFFTAAEYADSQLGKLPIPTGHEVLVTQSLAQRLWPGGDALGKQIWMAGKLPFTVVGIVADVLRANQNGSGLAGFHWSVFFPMSPAPMLSQYIVRTAPADRARVMREGMQKLQALAPNAVVKGQTFSEIRAKFFATNRSMVWMLVFVCVVMLAVTAVGIVGLTSFWVRQRSRQIGIRRAVGASRRSILRYFQTENFILSTTGVVLGLILAYGINLYLMQHYQLNRMSWYYLPVSAVALWILGQLAVLGPALRASNVPPVAATRSV